MPTNCVIGQPKLSTPKVAMDREAIETMESVEETLAFLNWALEQLREAAASSGTFDPLVHLYNVIAETPRNLSRTWASAELEVELRAIADNLGFAAWVLEQLRKEAESSDTFFPVGRLYEMASVASQDVDWMIKRLGIEQFED